MASVIMNYIPEVLHNVYGVLWAIEQNQGKITSKLIKGEIERLRGQWASEVINIALIALDHKPVVRGMVSSDAQVQTLVKMAKKDHEYIISKIKALRDARSQEKAEQSEVHIEVVDIDDEYEEHVKQALAFEDHYASVDEAAEIMGVSEQRIRAMIANGQFPQAKKYSGVWFLPKRDVHVLATKERKAGRPRK